MDSMFFVPCDSNGVFSSSFPSLAPETSSRRADFTENDEWSLLRMGKMDQTVSATSKPELFLLKSNSRSSSPNGERMLSFSSPRPDGTLSLYHYPSSLSMPSSSSAPSAPSYLKNGDLCYESSNVSINGVRGVFTPSQWMELEQQALIYKYIDAKMPVPSSLVIPIRRTINLSGFTSFTAGSYRSGSLRCGSYNLGFSGNIDPEPGRCRRTDGKKWRCSRDAVGDQKYCERHINRGRHRSRKHVEGHNGHVEKIATPIPSQSASAVSDGSSSNLTIAQQLQSKCLQSNSTKSISMQFDRTLTNKRNVEEAAQVSENTLFSKLRQQNSFEGIPPGNSNSQKTSSMPTPEIHAQQSITHPLLHFIDDWPRKDKVIADRTQLSISIHNDYSDYSLSPIRLVHEFNRLEDNKKRSSWMPISWDDPMRGGGPLGEVLTKIKEDH